VRARACGLEHRGFSCMREACCFPVRVYLICQSVCERMVRGWEWGVHSCLCVRSAHAHAQELHKPRGGDHHKRVSNLRRPSLDDFEDALFTALPPVSCIKSEDRPQMNGSKKVRMAAAACMQGVHWSSDALSAPASALSTLQVSRHVMELL